MRSHQIFRTYIPLVVFVFLFCVSGTAQSNVCKSVTVGDSIDCANMIGLLKNVTTSKLAGQVISEMGEPLDGVRVLVEIYKIDKKELKIESWSLTDLKKPFITIRANEKGEFCQPGLSEGYYVIRFGTSNGEWNCTWVRVHILRNSTFQKIKFALSIGI